MGSPCSKPSRSKKIQNDKDFYSNYASFAPKTDKKFSQINGVAPKLSTNGSNGIPADIRPPVRFQDSNLGPTGSPAVPKPRIDWESLEKSIQGMNLNILRDDLENDPHQFLVNMIMMSVQFFKNFER